MCFRAFRAQEPRKAAKKTHRFAPPSIRFPERTTPEEHPAFLQLSRTTPLRNKATLKARAPEEFTHTKKDLGRNHVENRRLCRSSSQMAPSPREASLPGARNRYPGLPSSSDRPFPEYSGGTLRLRRAYSGGPAPDFYRLPGHYVLLNRKNNFLVEPGYTIKKNMSTVSVTGL